MGGPGAGKGTQSAKIERALGIPHVSTGEIFRQHIEQQTDVGREIKHLLDDGHLAPDELTVRVVRERLADADCQQGCLLDGFPRSVAQAKALDEIVELQGGRVDLVINLEVSDDEVVSRLTSRRVCPVCGAIYNLEYNPPSVDGQCDNPACEGARLIQRDDDREDVIRERIRVYHRKTEPLLQFYGAKGVLKTVRGEGKTPDAVFAKIESYLASPDVACGT
ncbi:MAG: adenylate kinase [Candidatus Hydrogenedens sp.]|nr:adenylate kinase [Candidatus Hydrogenedens sp.]